MTVIVKPRKAPTGTSDEVITAWLNELLGSVSWPQFEATENGDLLILNTKFSMRIGTFLGVPSQAIIAQGQFLRMQHRKDFIGFQELVPLIAEAPDKSLYNGTPRWMPKVKPAPSPDDEYLQKMIAEMEKVKRECRPPHEIDHWHHAIRKTYEMILRKNQMNQAPIYNKPKLYGSIDPW
jgi:hypothetical protein